MNSEMSNEIKEIYKEFLHTDDGKKALFHACKIRKEALTSLKNGGDFNTTARVKMNLLCKEINSRTQSVSITPIGLNAWCHGNARLFSEKCGFRTRLGWNITACRCGGKMSFELHSLNKKDGVLYDFTKDMCDETEKYFVELNANMRPETYLNMLGCPEIFIVNNGCKCNLSVRKNLKLEILTENELLDMIDMLENVRIYC
jgi:hypothetical protein